SAQHYHKPRNPITVRDWKAALDATVIKQGVFCLVYHPYDWLKNEQVVELIDHAVAKHGKKVKFLTFGEALERLNKNLLNGHAMRYPENGDESGACLIDLNNDGFVDVVVGDDHFRQTRLWVPKKQSWSVGDFPACLVSRTDDKRYRVDLGVRFGLLGPEG